MKTARGNGKQVYEKIKEINGGYCMTEKLKPCPFCGRKDDEIEITQEFSRYPLYVECPCGCTLFGKFKSFN